MTLVRNVQRRLAPLVLALAVALGVPSAAAPQAVGQLFERARMLEETSSRNLSEAIAIYEQVATRRTENAQLAAQAQLRIGLLYERMGRNTDARRAFEAVIAQHAAQTAVAAEARARLQPDGAADAADAALGPHLVRKLNPDDGETQPSLSPDGRTLVLYKLGLLDLASGRKTHLNPAFTVSSDPRASEGRYEDAEWPVISHDGKRVAYVRPFWDTSRWTAQLRVMSTVPGGKPQTVVDDEEFTYFTPVGWSPDGTRVLTNVTLKDRASILAWVTTSDGTVTRLVSLGWRQYGRPSLSPTGRYVAYSALTSDPGGPLAEDARRRLPRHIYIQATDGSARTELSLTADVTDSSPVWAQDETAILFSSNRLGSFGIWTIPVNDGKPAGPAMLVRSTSEAELLGLTQSGQLYYQTSTDARTVSIVAAREGAAHTVVKNVVNGSVPSWSADGKRLAYVRPASNGPRLIVHAVETGEERSYAHDGLQVVAAQWFHDGRRLLAGVADKPGEDVQGQAGRNAWYVLDLQTGTWSRALPGDPQRGPVSVGPDDRSIYYVSFPHGSEGSMKVTKVDLVTGVTTQVFDFGTLPKGEHGVGRLSPDGRTWALRSSIGADTYVFTVSLDNGSYRELYHAPRAQAFVASALQWSGDSRTLYWVEQLGTAKDASPRRRVMQIAASGGPVQSSGMELDAEIGGSPEISPDGTLVALTRYRRDIELWSLNLGAVKGGR